jgi:hypothetical protein
LNKFEISIPDTFDLNNESVSIEVSSSTLEDLTFDSETSMLEILIKKEELPDMRGVHEIQVILADESGLSSEYTQFVEMEMPADAEIEEEDKAENSEGTSVAEVVKPDES